MALNHIAILLILMACAIAYAPIAFGLFFTSVLGFLLYTDLPLLFIFQTLFNSLDSYPSIMVIFFILCGNIAASGRIVKDLMELSNALMVKLPGGIGMAGILSCGLFGTISGSTASTVAAIGGGMIPFLRQKGYSENYSIGSMTACGNLGMIIPPSISMILYGMFSHVSVEGLFLTGIVPGVLIIGITCGYTFYISRNNPKLLPQTTPLPGDFQKTLKEGIWSILLPVIISVGMYSRLLTATETAAVACAYAVIVELFIHRSLNCRTLKKITINSAVSSATLLIIFVCATCFSRILALQNTPDALTETLTSIFRSPALFLLIINLFLLLLGALLDIISATLILGPIFLPLLSAFKVDPMHFGLIMTLNLAIGYCMPPAGVSLYITSAITNRRRSHIIKACVPFIIIQLTVLTIVTFMPSVVLWLPKTCGFYSP